MIQNVIPPGIGSAFRYTALFEALPGSCILLQNDAPLYTVLAATPEYLTQTGYRKEDIIGKGIFEMSPANPNDPTDTGARDLRESLEHVRLYKESHQLPVQRYDIAGEDGSFSEKYWRACNKPALSPDGEVAYIIHAAEDITASIKAEKREEAHQELEIAYQKVEEREAALKQFKFMADNAQDPFILMRKDGTFAYLNPKALEAWGYAEAEVAGIRVPDANPIYNDAAFRELFAKAQEQTIPQFETLHKRKDGTIFPVEVKVNGITLDGKPYLFAIARNINERKRIEEALVESESRFRTMIEQAPVAITLTQGEDVIIESINASMLQIMHKQSKEEVLDKKMIEVLPEIKDQPVLAIVKNVLRTGESFVGTEIPADLMINGALQTHYYNLSYTRIADNKETPSVLHVAVDVTEQVVARRKIEESEAKYRSLFESIDQGFCIIEMIFNDAGKPVDYRFLEVNPVFEKQTGLKDAIGKTIRQLIPDLEPHWFERYGKIALTAEPLRFTEGSEAMGRWFDVFAFKAGGAESRRVALLFTDITERQKAEQAVRQSESNLRNMIMQSPVAMCILRGSTFVVDVANQVMLDIWGETAGEMMGKPIFQSLPEAGAQGLERVMQEVYKTGERFVANELPVSLPRKGAVETVYINFVYEPFKGADGTIIGIMAVAIDVTEQILARQKIEEVVARRTAELAQANDALISSNRDLARSNVNLGEFAYAASHDLKEPIRKIHFFADRLKSTLSGQLNEEQARSFERLETSARRMSSLIDNLLSFSQVSFQPNIDDEVDLNRLIEVVLEDLDLEIEDKGAIIDVDPLFTIKGHHRQLQQVFQNLIGNAIKYTKAGVAPTVQISCSKVPGKETSLHLPEAEQDRFFYCVSVQDNGIGFEQEDAERIFNVFTRLHGNSEYKGTGIGLSIVRKVIENHKGFIRAESNPGAGTTFKIYLPVEL